MKANSNSAIPFECSFCGTKWETVKPKYKVSTVKYENVWIIYSSTCPECKRETTSIFQQIKKEGQ